jgi:uncharacterized protein YfaS (alpha-2-macroglobulin family)
MSLLNKCSLPALVSVCLLGAIACSLFSPKPGGQTNPPLGSTPSGTSGTTQGASAVQGGESLLNIHLSEGRSLPQAPVPMAVMAGEPLSDTLIAQIVARLPAFPVQEQPGGGFKLPTELLPPPRTGQTIQESFPPPAIPPPPEPVEVGPLKVLRFSPEGEIPLAPFIDITFNQSMVPLATLEVLAAGQVPVLVEPSLKGTWRWIGTKTLTFQYDSTEIDRLPMATEYQVTVPAGTRSATGGVLAEAVQWSFSTPPVMLVSAYPSDGPQPLEPLFFVAFNQRIDPNAVLETVKVTAGSQPVEIVLAAQTEIEKDKQVSYMVKNALDGRWLVFKATKPLPADTDIRVTIGPGTPSAEGPLVTKEAQGFSFHTYAPLRIEEHGCTSYSDRCPPLTPLYIRFNNPIDSVAYKESMLRIEPELPGAVVDIYGNTITIRGATKGQTTYQVTLDGAIQDIFGQTLGKPARLSFKVTTAEPFLAGPNKTLVTLDPAASKPVFSVFTLNYTKLDVRIYAVQPGDWPAFKDYLRKYNEQPNKAPTPPGRLVQDTSMTIEAPADELTEASVDLSKLIDGKYGHFIVIIEPRRSLFQNPNVYWPIVQCWVQVTQIGIDAFADHSQMLAWVSALKDGSPMQGVEVETGDNGLKVVTGQDGTVRFDLPASGTTYLIARKGADTAVLPRSDYAWGDDRWQPWPVRDMLRWYVFDDRGMYRPGEEVHVKGWLRRVGGKQDGDVGLVGSLATSVYYQLSDPTGNEIAKGQSEVNALGGFDFVITLPDKTNLGYAQLMLSAQGNLGDLDNLSYNHSFQIQEFRRPEFEVIARNETVGPYFAGGHAVVAVAANYYAGGPLPNAQVDWQVTYSPSSYAPPNWPGFVFGFWSPWWGDVRMALVAESFGPWQPPQGAKVETFTAKTDPTGNHYLSLDFEAQGEPKPFSVVAQATVMDVNRQAWVGTTSLLVHPANLYVGLRSERYFVERGTPLKIDLIVTDLDGNPVPDRPIKVRAARLEWKFRGSSWNEEEVDVQECTVGSSLEPVSCTFQTPLGGSYRITAVITDDKGRPNQSQFTRWVSGGKQPAARQVEQETATLIPDKETYQPGDVAQILVQSPFSPAEGSLTVSRSGILYTKRFRIEDGSTTLQVPIEAQHIPNLNVQVDVVGSAPRTDDQGQVIRGVPPRPAFATGHLNLSIPPLQRKLTLKLKPGQTELEPGGETTLSVSLLDANNRPVAGAELAVVVVDEAILALSNYQLPDPLAIFYQDRSPDFSATYIRSSIVLVDPQALLSQVTNARDKAGLAGQPAATMQASAIMEAPVPMAAPSAEGAKVGAQPVPIQVRTDFNPLAVFAPAVHTDSDGQAKIELKLPDNLTRYRVMVVAVDDSNRFGTAEANLVARLPLMVRPSAPRFLNFGDRFELPVVLQNQTDQSLAVDLVMQVGNLKLNGTSGIQVSVPARDRVEVRFPASTINVGTARFRVAAVSGAYADAASGELPVYTPATTEAFATYGVVDEGAISQPVAAPGDVFPQFGGLEIDTSSTALQSLTDAVLYLQSYPFECSEQLASRILSVAALRDVLTAFSADGMPSPEAMVNAVQRDIKRLQGMQSSDGGFPYWVRERESIPFNTIHVAHALQMAKIKGFEVPAEMQQLSQEYLRQIESHYPEWYGQSTRYTLSAYALYVRSLMGDTDREKAHRLLDEAGLEQLSLEAVAWLWQVLADDILYISDIQPIRQYINNRVVETPGAANFTIQYNEQSYLLLESDRRADALILDALIRDNPQSDLIPKVVNGLMAHRTKGRWYNTQENVFILLALDHYFKTYEAQTPDFVAGIWLGETYAGSHKYVGRTTERHSTDIPMAYLVNAAQGSKATQDLILSKDGPGRLYYRLGLSYAPTDLTLKPLDMGFVVQRRYEAVDDPQDVTQDKDGVWHIKAGARVRVRLTMVADNRRYHVALVDPLPAGLEIVNPELAGSGSVPQDPNSSDYRYGWWWWSAWYEHQNMRDERAEAFTSLLWEGVYQYTYIARATTPGTFVVPPAKAEEMYSPEVFGRSGSDKVVIEY